MEQSDTKNQLAPEGQNTTSSYRSIFKATSLFGGIQVYQILIRVIKAKFVAILLGPAGMGIMGLYYSTLDLIKSVSTFGIDRSAVRDISEANGCKDNKRIGSTVATVQRLVWLTGLLGLVITLFLSPVLSRLTFGNSDFTWGFIILSITLLIDQLCAGQKVVLQGMRKLKNLAKASAIGATIGLFVSIPLYYWLGVNGIVPAMVLSSITAMILSWHFSHQIKYEKVVVTNKQALENGRSMLRMGIAMSVSGILVTLFAYILRWFIRQQGGVEEVGLFAAGFTIMSTYVGMVFTAMSTDYYPRLAAVNKDNEKCKGIINQQGEIAVLILAPMVVSCIVFMPFIIRLIYSEKFLPAADYILWAILGTMFKSASWSISFSFLAKAESKLFIINESFSNVRSLLFNLAGYYWGGLTGLGIAYLLNQFCYLIQVYIIAHKRYLFNFSRSFVTVFMFQFSVVMTSFIIIHSWNSHLAYIPLVILLIVSGGYSVRELDSRMGILQFVRNKLKK